MQNILRLLVLLESIMEYYIIFSFFTLIYEAGPMCATVCVQSEDNWQELILFCPRQVLEQNSDPQAWSTQEDSISDRQTDRQTMGIKENSSELRERPHAEADLRKGSLLLKVQKKMRRRTVPSMMGSTGACRWGRAGSTESTRVQGTGSRVH